MMEKTDSFDLILFKRMGFVLNLLSITEYEDAVQFFNVAVHG